MTIDIENNFHEIDWQQNPFVQYYALKEAKRIQAQENISSYKVLNSILTSNNNFPLKNMCAAHAHCKEASREKCREYIL